MLAVNVHSREAVVQLCQGLRLLARGVRQQFTVARTGIDGISVGGHALNVLTFKDALAAQRVVAEADAAQTLVGACPQVTLTAFGNGIDVKHPGSNEPFADALAVKLHDVDALALNNGQHLAVGGCQHVVVGHHVFVAVHPL